MSFPCHADCDSLSSFAHISAQPRSHTGPNVYLFTFCHALTLTHTHTHRITATQFIMRNFCFLKAKICKKWSTTVLLPNLFDLYKSKGKRINTALLRVQILFTAFHFQCCCRATVGCFISHLHSRVIGLGWHLMWQTLCEDVETE